MLKMHSPPLRYLGLLTSAYPLCWKQMLQTRAWELCFLKFKMAGVVSSLMQVGVFEEPRETWRTTAARSLNFWLLSGPSLRSSGTVSIMHTSPCTGTTILWPTSWPKRGCQPLNKDGWMPWQGTTSPSRTDQESTTPMLMNYPGGHRSLSLPMKYPATWHLFWGAQRSPCPCRRSFWKQSPYWSQTIKQHHSLRSSSPRHCLATQLLGLHSFSRQTQGYRPYCGFTSRAGALQQRRGRHCQRRQRMAEHHQELGPAEWAGLSGYLWDHGLQLLTPPELQEHVLDSLHGGVGHQGAESTELLIRERFLWPGLRTSVQDWITRCKRCTLAKMPYKPLQTKMESILATLPLEVVCLDFDKLERACGKEDVLVITDVYSKFTVAVATKDQTAKITTKAFIQEWLTKYGTPAWIHSDRGSNFESQLIQELCQ